MSTNGKTLKFRAAKLKGFTVHKISSCITNIYYKLLIIRNIFIQSNLTSPPTPSDFRASMSSRPSFWFSLKSCKFLLSAS